MHAWSPQTLLGLVYAANVPTLVGKLEYYRYWHRFTSHSYANYCSKSHESASSPVPTLAFSEEIWQTSLMIPSQAQTLEKQTKSGLKTVASGNQSDRRDV